MKYYLIATFDDGSFTFYKGVDKSGEHLLHMAAEDRDEAMAFPTREAAEECRVRFGWDEDDVQVADNDDITALMVVREFVK